MIQFISHLIKVIIAFILSLFFSSCHQKTEVEHFFSTIEGSDKTISERRELSDFDKIEVSQAINVELTQGNIFFVEVETNENVMPYLITEVNGGVLKIFYKKKFNSFRNTDTKIKITLPEFQEIESSSASNVVTKGSFLGEKIQLKTTSASTLTMTLEYDLINVEASSASQVRLKGLSLESYFESSSASDIDAQELKSNKIVSNASSAGSISVFPIKEITANAASGGGITFKNKAQSESVKSSSGGSIHKSY